MKKVCSLCKTEKDIAEFYKNRSKKDGHSHACRDCKKIQQTAWYADHQKEQRKRVAANSKKYIEACRAVVYEYLLTHPCVDCGESDPIVLEFDHLKNKIDVISRMIRRAGNTQAVRDEIAKCEVRCANCHRRIEAQRRNYWKYKLASVAKMDNAPDS